MGTEALLALLTHLAVGRLCLSLLAPGWPGYHDRKELGATLCASLMLGLLALEVLPWLWIWALVLLVRLAVLPGALRPRHEHERSPAIAWEIAFIVLVVLYVDRFPDPLLVAIGLGVAWVVIGTRTWMRRADRRARALAVLGVLTPLGVAFL